MTTLYTILTSTTLLHTTLTTAFPFLICTNANATLLTLNLITTILGRPLSYLQCAGFSSLSIKRTDADGLAYTLATRLEGYLSHFE